VSPSTTSDLIRNGRSAYGDKWPDHLLEQYRLYVESANKVSERRASANNYLLTVNAALVTLYGLGVQPKVFGAWQLAVPVAGIALCVVWWQLIVSYRQLNGVKFRVVQELEAHLPAGLYSHEWRLAEQGRGNAYMPFTHLEWAVPCIFAALFLILAVASVWGPPRDATSGAHEDQPRRNVVQVAPDLSPPPRPAPEEAR